MKPACFGNHGKKCLETGFNEFVAKPIDLSLLELLVNKYINKTTVVEF